MRMGVALTVATAVVAAAGCSKGSPEGTSPVQSPIGIEWRLASISGTAAPLGANGQPATLLLDAVSGRASGYAGCNTFSGSYTLSGTSLTFGPLAMTRMACAKGDQLERTYTMALEQTTTITMTAAGMELRRGTIPLARFTR